MKIKDLRKKSTGELLKMLKQLQFGKVKASINTDNLSKKERGEDKVKGVVKQGSKTSMQKDIRRNIAKIKTLLKEREE